MSRIKWEGYIEDRRKALREEGKSYREIADILSQEFHRNITKDMVSSRDRLCRINSNDSNNTKMFDDELYNLKEKYILAEKIKKDLKQYWDMFNNGRYKKILSLSDLHAPYIDFKKVEQALNDNQDCTICVLNGDIFDGESMSTFDKLDEIDSSEEFNQIFKLLDVLTTRFETIIFVGGNHDLGRFQKYITRNIKAGLRKYAYDRLNPIKYICEHYNNIISINYNLFQIGDVVFKHPSGYSSAELKTVVNEMDILSANRYDLPNPNFRCICIGHTHDAGEFVKNGVKLIEQGCLTYTPDYRFNSPTKRRWTMGYARIEIDENGKVLFNKSRVVYLND